MVLVLHSLDHTLIFPSHLIPSPVHPTGFSFCFFPGFLAIFIMFSLNNNNRLFIHLDMHAFIRTETVTDDDKIPYLCSQLWCALPNMVSLNLHKAIYVHFSSTRHAIGTNIVK